MLTLDTNAGQVADDLSSLVPTAVADGDKEAAALALRLVDPRTPRRSGALAAGLRSAVEPAGGFTLSDPVPYANVVNARTGFASETIAKAEAEFVAVYDHAAQTAADRLT